MDRWTMGPTMGPTMVTICLPRIGTRGFSSFYNQVKAACNLELSLSTSSILMLANMRNQEWAWKLDSLPSETNTLVLNLNLSGNDNDHGASRDSTQGSTQGLTQSSAPSDILSFLNDNVSFVADRGQFKLLLPVVSGYVAQADFLGRRMIDCLGVAKVQSFVTPGQHVEGRTVQVYSSMSMTDLLPYCYGGVIVSDKEGSASVNDDISNRISFPWLSPSPVIRKRLAVVGAGSLSKMEGYAVAARSLNVALVAFDDATQWIARDAYSHLREDFVPLDMTVDHDIAQRIAAALSEYRAQSQPLDGLMTCDEHLLTVMSHVAVLAGFAASPPESVGLAQNKFKTRQLDTNVYCRLVRSPADLEKLLAEDGARLEYPLIVKPARGWSSEGVWRVESEQQLRDKVPTLWRDAFTAWHGVDVVIETYVDGPEVDANMVLADGKVVFFETNDDFPSTGDYNYDDESKGQVANFVETSNMLPSALPPNELEALQQRLHELVLSAGFRDGVLHIEAKLRNSSCHYAKSSDPHGLVDLQHKQSSTTARPEDVFLIEINPRAPGWQEVEATARAYGVSYYTLSVLSALADKKRVVALSQPFLGGAQYHVQLLFVAAQRGGVYHYGDVCTAVLDGRGRHLAAHVAKGVSLMENGQEVPDPRTGQVFGSFIAFFLVTSHTSRREAMLIGRELEQLVWQYTDNF